MTSRAAGSCDAEVAEIPFTAFTSRKKAEHVPCRLIVRRVKLLQPAKLAAAEDAGQAALFADWRYHAFITNTDLDLV